jgi:RNA polymerase sigma-70 factor (ECF subfamily)
VGDALDAAYRANRGAVLARLIAVVGDFDLAEDALQDAFVAAAAAWEMGGVPKSPGAWLFTTGRRKAIDRLRRSSALERRHRAWGELAIAWDAWDAGESDLPLADDRLRLIFTCCHPALALEARVALTLRSLGGLSTEEVAHAFFVPVSTMAQRVVRAKRKIREAGIGYRVPGPGELPERLAAVLAVIYLIFNAGYLPGGGDHLVRVDLCEEAIRLADVLVALLPDESEPLGLSALLLLQDARRQARIGDAGQALTLEEQDRSRWDQVVIAQGLERLDWARGVGRPGPYWLKAAIAAVHSCAPRAAETNWQSIVALYDQLLAWEPTPVVRLNRAVAVAMAGTPADGLAVLDDPELSEALRDYHLFHLTRADLLRRCGRVDEASVAYEEARDHTANLAEHAFLDRRLAELGPETSNSGRFRPP